ncbi:hypothetical protein [Desertibaculum subflavum]|uniref:hypothetical protein n=1 Tax=Desertibaculum subflavum TaxID=2268458 RepID=UPI000E667644
MTLLNTTGNAHTGDTGPAEAEDGRLEAASRRPDLAMMTEAELTRHLEAALAAEVAAEAARQPTVLALDTNISADPKAPPAPAGITRRGTPRIRRRDVKWRHAAVMIARGVGVTEISYEYGVCESQILRNLRRSARFRQWIREAEAAVEADAARHAAWLRLRAAASLADKAEGRDPKTLELIARQIAELARNRIGEAETRPEAAYARLSGFTKKDFR